MKYQGLSFVCSISEYSFMIFTASMSRRKVFGNPIPSTSNKRLRTSTLLEVTSENSHSGEVSKYFSNDSKNPTEPLKIPEKIIDLQNELVKNLKVLNLICGQVKYLYNPLEYASEPNHNFIKKYCNSTKKILFVGLNPGPNGMCQTGIPFGDPKWVRDWLKIDGHVFKPEIECPDRKIYGIASPKSEPSGDRLWTYFSKLSITPETFFKHSFVFNFCPVAFMETNGRNVTPEDFTDSKVLFKYSRIFLFFIYKAYYIYSLAHD